MCSLFLICHLQVLSYLDFFPTGVQRTAVATAANICRGLTPEHADAVATAAPILIGLLQYQVGVCGHGVCLWVLRGWGLQLGALPRAAKMPNGWRTYVNLVLPVNVSRRLGAWLQQAIGWAQNMPFSKR